MRGGVISVALSLECDLRRELPGTVPRWSPDFPPPYSYPYSGGRPALWPRSYNSIAFKIQQKLPQYRPAFAIDHTVQI